jgi:hypothetical protein
VAGRDAGAEGLLSEADAAQLEAQASQKQDPEAHPPSGQAGEVLAGVPPETRAESAVERAVGNESGETQGGGGWINLANLLAVVSVPVIWACWLRHEMKSRQSSEDARGDLAKRRIGPWPNGS